MAATSGVSTLLPRGEALRLQYDDRSGLCKIVGVAASIFRQIRYFIILCWHRLFGAEPQHCHQQITWNPQSSGLVAFFHGLRSHPGAWNTHGSLLETHTTIDLFAPQIPEGGACSLQDAVTPILPHILSYTQAHPGKPICLFGVSNGSRIATWLETELRQRAPTTPVKVTTIAGIHMGTKRMDLMRSLGIAQCIYPEALTQELSYDSDKSQELLGRVRERLPTGCAPRSYQFCATADDLVVPDLDSSLPDLTAQDHFKVKKFTVVHGHSHDSIVAAVAEPQIHSSIKWINKF